MWLGEHAHASDRSAFQCFVGDCFDISGFDISGFDDHNLDDHNLDDHNLDPTAHNNRRCFDHNGHNCLDATVDHVADDSVHLAARLREGIGVRRGVAPPPRVTYPLDAELPPIVWAFGELAVEFTPPAEFRQDPRPNPPIHDCDRINGLFLLERWRVEGEPMLATLSVQAKPGADSPLLSRTVFSESVAGNGATWYLWNNASVDQAGLPPNFGLTVLGDYLLVISGSPTTIRDLVNALVID